MDYPLLLTNFTSNLSYKYAFNQDLCPGSDLSGGENLLNGGIGSNGELQCFHRDDALPAVSFRYIVFGQYRFTDDVQIMGAYIGLEEAKEHLEIWYQEEQKGVSDFEAIEGQIQVLKTKKKEDEDYCQEHKIDGFIGKFLPCLIYPCMLYVCVYLTHKFNLELKDGGAGKFKESLCMFACSKVFSLTLTGIF